jgi:hypothetical protein
VRPGCVTSGDTRLQLGCTHGSPALGSQSVSDRSRNHTP